MTLQHGALVCSHGQPDGDAGGLNGAKPPIEGSADAPAEQPPGKPADKNAAPEKKKTE